MQPTTNPYLRYLLIFIGWVCIVLGIIGALLPLLPTTPFLILALSCFAKSSPRFQAMLLNNKWVGPSLTQWQNNKTVAPKIKYRAMALMIVSFSVSIFFFVPQPYLQIILASICFIILAFIWHLKEPEQP